ncbi:NAD-dependent epimerase/dehydratase [soil metagenome]
MSEERFLITGAFGCIGSWAVKLLRDEGVEVWTYDLPGNPHRLKLLMDDARIGEVHMLEGDITNHQQFRDAVKTNDISHVIHLAALQVPFVRANPVLGAQVNVVGSTIVLETARELASQVRGLAYASSIAVYGPTHLYPDGPLEHDAEFAPTTLYGVNKQDNEWTARIYWQDYQLRSTGLRPFFVYGPGRDQGISSLPTKAMLAAAVGRPYEITFDGYATFQHAEDCARSFITAARSGLEGAQVFNLGGTKASMSEVVAAIEEAVPEAKGSITVSGSQMPFPTDIDGKPAEDALGALSWRPFAEGVKDTIEDFKAAVDAGRLDVDRAIS